MSLTTKYRQVLGIDASATLDDIKDAHRKLAREYHPSRNSGNAQAAARFKEVYAAFAFLTGSDEYKQREEQAAKDQELTIQQPEETGETWDVFEPPQPPPTSTPAPPRPVPVQPMVTPIQPPRPRAQPRPVATGQRQVRPPTGWLPQDPEPAQSVTFGGLGIWGWMAVLVVLAPIVAAAGLIFDPTAVINPVTHLISSLVGFHNLNEMVYTSNICPNGSVANRPTSLWWLLVTVLQLVPIIAIYVAIPVFAIGSIPCILVSAFMAGFGVVSGDSEATQKGILVFVGWLGAIVALGLCVRGLHLLTLAEAGC